MNKHNDQEREREHTNKRLNAAGVPWPEMVADYLLSIKKGNTRRIYRLHLEERLPVLDALSPWDVELAELAQIREQIQDDTPGDESRRQAFAALLGCFQSFREHFPFNKFSDETIERLFGSEMAYQRRKTECFMKLSYQEAEEQGLLPDPEDQ